MTYTSPPRLNGTISAEDEKLKCLDSRSILRATLEFGPACNLNCIYCYASDHLRNSSLLTEDDCYQIIEQLMEAGAGSIVLIGGGEPLLYPYWKRVAQSIRQQGLTPILFTNGQLLDDKAIQHLSDIEASVILKMDSLDLKIQDTLAGKEGAAKTIYSAANRLLKHGFNKNGVYRFAIHSVICKLNIKMIPDMWLWARERDIIPLFQLITLQGRGANPSLSIQPKEAYRLFKELLDIDKNEYGYSWPIQPPYVGDSCLKLLYNVYIRYSGQISPCVGVPLDLGNILEKPLKEILESPEILNYRKIMQNLHGKCTTCSRSGKCYGCRGTTFAQTGDPFSSDPTCWVENGQYY